MKATSNYSINKKGSYMTMDIWHLPKFTELELLLLDSYPKTI